MWGLNRRPKASSITLGDRATRDGKWDLAAGFYRKALDRNPRNPPIWVQYGHVLKATGRLAEAEAAYRRSLAYDATIADTHLQLGHLLKLQGRPDEAQAAYLRAFALRPDHPDPVSELASLGWPAIALAELQGSERGLSGYDPDRDSAWRTDGTRDQRFLVPSARQFRVLYVSGAPEIPSHQYRVDNYVAALARQGIDASWIPADEWEDHAEDLYGVSLIVLWRAPLTPELDELVTIAERLGIPTVFDIDDYVFEPLIASAQFIDGIRFVPEHEIEGYHWGIRGYRAMLLRCRFATFTTRFLVERGEELGRRSFHLPNGLDPHFLAAEPRHWPENSSAPLIIGYTPGTRTHQRDVRIAAPAVRRVLDDIPTAILRIVGDFDISEVPEWSGLGQRIELDVTVGRDYVRKKIPEFDVNIAPVEIDNPFTEAKSELKYFEAACLGVPTIASATAVFRDAIRHGETGFLAATEQEWFDALIALSHDAALRRDIGAAARDSVISCYGLDTLGATARRVYADIITRHREGIGRTDRALSVTMMMVEPFRGSGGHAKAISLMRGLAGNGHDVALHFGDSLGELGTPEAVRREYDLPDSVVISSGQEALRPCDVAIATFWKTAYTLAEMPNFARIKAYFMQDYEPLFYPMGDEYILAQQSYKLGLHNISYGPWVKDRIMRDLDIAADAIPFFIDKSTFYPDPEVARSKDRLVVFGRPEMPRRLWQITLTAIEGFVARTGFSGSIEFFGSHTKVEAAFPCVQYGMITPKEMAGLFRAGTLGIAISSTNPSMVPFEMMACGLPVVDIDLNNKEVSYGGRHNAFLAEPTSEHLAETIARAMADEHLRTSVVMNAWNVIDSITETKEAIPRFERLLFDYLRPD